MRIRLHVQELDRPELVAHDRILRRYGPNCYPQDPEERDDHWKVPVGSYFQSKVIDEKNEKEKVFILNFQNVGEILVRKSTNTVFRATTLRTLGKNIFEKKSVVRKIVEQDLIKILGKKELNIRFGQLKFAFSGLQPIYRTVSRLLQEDYPTYEDLLMMGNYAEQVDLLIELGYAEYTDTIPKRLIATNKMKELFVQEKLDTNKTIDAIFGLVLSEFYYDLQKSRRIAQFIPYVRASTAYYGDAVQFGKLISIKEHRLRDNIRDYYRGAPVPLRLRYAYPTLIRELVEAQILNYDDQYITGRADIFERLIDVRSQLQLKEGALPFNW